MIKIKKKLVTLALAVMAVTSVMSTALATPAHAEETTGWHHGIFNEWTYTDCLYKNVTGWHNIDHTWYHFRSDGVMETGWRLYGHWYDLGSDGAMRTGWVKDDGDWYYLGGDGAMRTGWQCVSGSWYYLFPSSGRMASDCYIDGYHLNSSGAWDY